jgi:hypothetical protein
MKLSWGWIADRAEHAFTSVRLAILAKICCPEPPTVANEIRQLRREQLQKVFPEIGIGRGRPTG